MDREIGCLTDIRATCTWPGCDRGPDVSVDYEQGRARDLRLAWLPAHGGVNLCERHATVRRNARSGRRPGARAREARVTRVVTDSLPPENAGRPCAWPGCRRAAGVLLEFEVPGDDDATVPGWLPALHQTARLCRQHAREMPAALAPGRVISMVRV